MTTSQQFFDELERVEQAGLYPTLDDYTRALKQIKFNIVSRLLRGRATNTRYTLTDGSEWDIVSDGTIKHVKG